MRSVRTLGIEGRQPFARALSNVSAAQHIHRGHAARRFGQRRVTGRPSSSGVRAERGPVVGALPEADATSPGLLWWLDEGHAERPAYRSRRSGLPASMSCDSETPSHQQGFADLPDYGRCAALDSAAAGTADTGVSRMFCVRLNCATAGSGTVSHLTLCAPTELRSHGRRGHESQWPSASTPGAATAWQSCWPARHRDAAAMLCMLLSRRAADDQQQQRPRRLRIAITT